MFKKKGGVPGSPSSAGVLSGGDEDDCAGWDERPSDNVNVALLPIAEHARSAPARFRSAKFAPLPLVSEILQYAPATQDTEIQALREVAVQLDADAHTIVDVYWEGFNKSIKSYSSILERVTEAQQSVEALDRLLVDVQRLQDDPEARQSTPNKGVLSSPSSGQPLPAPSSGSDKRTTVSKLEYLWSRYLEYCETVDLYDKIRLIRDAIPAADEYNRAGFFLHASAVLKRAVDTIAQVAEFDILGIRDLCASVLDAKQRLADKIVAKLSEHVYLRKIGAGGNAKKSGALLAGASSSPSALPSDTDDAEVESRVAFKLSSDPNGLLADTTETSDEDLTKPPESDTKVFIKNCVHSLHLLAMINNATSELQKLIRKEVRKLFKPTKVALALAAKEVESLSGVPTAEVARDVADKAHSLEEMFDVCTQVVRNHAAVAEAIAIYQPSNFFTIAYVWERMQNDILEVLKPFLQSPDVARAKASNLLEQNKLFSFAAAAMAAADEKAQTKGNKSPSLERQGNVVEVGNPRNVIVLYPMLATLDERVNNLLGRPMSPPLKPILRSFMDNFVETQYIPFCRFTLRQRTDEILSAPSELLRAVGRHEDNDGEGPVHQLLSSFVAMHRITRMLHEDIVSMPQFCEPLLTLLEEALIRFFGRCEELYSNSAGKSLLEGGTALCVRILHGRETKEVVALLKSDPYWVPAGELVDGDDDAKGGAALATSGGIGTPFQSRRDDDAKSTASGGSLPFSSVATMEVDEIKQYLPAALTDMNYTINKSQLVMDVHKLVQLADLHTSLDWFVRKLRHITRSIADAQSKQSTPPPASPISSSKKLKKKMTMTLLKRSFGMLDTAPDSPVAKLRQKIEALAVKFATVAENAIFTLRLELKLHCLYNLSECRKTMYCCDESESQPDPGVLELNRFLAQSEEMLAAHLQPHRMRFVVDGIAPLISTAMIGNVAAIQRINRSGIRKLLRNVFAIQQNLSIITLRKEQYFDRARQYFELLYLVDHQELYSHISQKIAERKPLFTLDQYRCILELQTPGRKISALVLQTFQKLIMGLDR